MKKAIEIIYQNSDLVVINKPTGISVTKDRSGKVGLLTVLSEQLSISKETPLKLIHRLDKSTSGVMMLAKNRDAQSKYSSLFEKRLVKKTYLALVRAAMMKDRGTIKASIAPSKRNPRLMCVTRKKSKAARTDWQLLADFGSIALLKVCPVTGRTHQIRVHMACAHMPLAYDDLYARTHPIYLSDFKFNYRLPRGQKEKALMERLTLHAYQLEIAEPIDDTVPKIFTAGLDKSFKATVKMLAKHNPNGLEAFIDPENLTNIINTKSFEASAK